VTFSFTHTTILNAWIRLFLIVIANYRLCIPIASLAVLKHFLLHTWVFFRLVQPIGQLEVQVVCAEENVKPCIHTYCL